MAATYPRPETDPAYTAGGATDVELGAVIAAIAASPDQIIVGAITRDDDGAALSAGVVWPDGDIGTYTATTVSTDFPGSVDAYTVTKGSTTFTQPAVTRDSEGAVVVRPAITES